MSVFLFSTVWKELLHLWLVVIKSGWWERTMLVKVITLLLKISLLRAWAHEMGTHDCVGLQSVLLYARCLLA